MGLTKKNQRPPPFCERCGMDLRRTKTATIEVKDATAGRMRRQGWLCKSRFRTQPHMSPKGIDALYASAGIKRPDPWALLERLTEASAKQRVPARVLGPRQHKKALADFHPFYRAYVEAADELKIHRGLKKE